MKSWFIKYDVVSCHFSEKCYNGNIQQGNLDVTEILCWIVLMLIQYFIRCSSFLKKHWNWTVTRPTNRFDVGPFLNRPLSTDLFSSNDRMLRNLMFEPTALNPTAFLQMNGIYSSADKYSFIYSVWCGLYLNSYCSLCTLMIKDIWHSAWISHEIIWIWRISVNSFSRPQILLCCRVQKKWSDPSF